MILTPWTREADARLLELVREGLSASQIAAQIGGVSRNAVVGRLFRMREAGIDAPKLGFMRPRDWRPTKPKRISTVTLADVLANMVAKKVERREDVAVEPAPEAETVYVPTVAIEMPRPAPRDNTPRHFLDVRTFDCRFPEWNGATPLSEKRYCCRPVERGSYCAEHARLCYQPSSASKASPWYERRAAA